MLKRNSSHNLHKVFCYQQAAEQPICLAFPSSFEKKAFQRKKKYLPVCIFKEFSLLCEWYQHEVYGIFLSPLIWLLERIRITPGFVKKLCQNIFLYFDLNLNKLRIFDGDKSSSACRWSNFGNNSSLFFVKGKNFYHIPYILLLQISSLFDMKFLLRYVWKCWPLLENVKLTRSDRSEIFSGPSFLTDTIWNLKRLRNTFRHLLKAINLVTIQSYGVWTRSLIESIHKEPRSRVTQIRFVDIGKNEFIKISISH